MKLVPTTSRLKISLIIKESITAKCKSKAIIPAPQFGLFSCSFTKQTFHAMQKFTLHKVRAEYKSKAVNLTPQFGL